MNKPVHVKPAIYSLYYYDLKVIAEKYGYNLVLHGSLARDMDLIAIPWVEVLGDVENMIQEFACAIGGSVMTQSAESQKCFPHGRESRLISINRKHIEENHPWFQKGRQEDLQYYLDISVIPALPTPSIPLV